MATAPCPQPNCDRRGHRVVREVADPEAMDRATVDPRDRVAIDRVMARAAPARRLAAGSRRGRRRYFPPSFATSWN